MTAIITKAEINAAGEALYSPRGWQMYGREGGPPWRFVRRILSNARHAHDPVTPLIKASSDFRAALIQSGALNRVQQCAYIAELRALEAALRIAAGGADG